MTKRVREPNQYFVKQVFPDTFGGLPLPQGEGWGEGIIQFSINYPLILTFSRREKGLLDLHRALEHSEKRIRRVLETYLVIFRRLLRRDIDAYQIASETACRTVLRHGEFYSRRR